MGNKTALVKVNFPARARRAMRVAQKVWNWWVPIKEMAPGPLMRIDEIERGTFDFYFQVQFWVRDCWRIAVECVTVVMEEMEHNTEKSGSGGNVFFDYGQNRKTWKVSRIEIEWQAMTHQPGHEPERRVWSTDEQMIALTKEAKLDQNDIAVTMRRGGWGQPQSGCHSVRAGVLMQTPPEIPEEQAKPTMAPARCSLPSPEPTE